MAKYREKSSSQKPHHHDNVNSLFNLLTGLNRSL